MTWTKALVAELKHRLADGLSASQLAAELGFGLSRNAVIGKVRRLGLEFTRKPAGGERRGTRRVPPVKARGRVTPSKPARLNYPHTGQNAGAARDVPLSADNFLPEVPGAPTGLRAAVMGLTARTCRWPLGDPRDDGFRFCCAEPIPEAPYCGAHCRAAYDFAASRRCGARRVERQLETTGAQ